MAKNRRSKKSGGRRQDHFAARAKREGNPARSIYKLEEIDQRQPLFKSGNRVLDLGCSPGSWMLYAAKRVGDRGWVLGYDLKEVNAALPAHAEARVGDVYELEAADLGQFDVVMSDMAPATMGHHTTDALRSAALVERALDIADARLREGGSVVVKLLEGGEIESLVRRMRATYNKVSRHRPKATRKESTEVFLVGRGKKNQDLPSDDGFED